MTLSRLGTWLLWLTGFALLTWGLSSLSGIPDIRISHAILTYLVFIIVVSRQGGRALSMAMVALSYLAVDWFFVPPRYAFGAASDLDWFVLIGFLATGWLFSELFAKQREALRIAEERTIEVERLSRERLQLEREASTVRVLREADRLKNALLNSLAHDLRSPVATLSLLVDPAAGFPVEVMMNRVGEEAGRLSQYLGMLQRVATEGGGNALALASHDAFDIVQTALHSSEAVIAGRRIRIEPPATRATVWCDLTLCVQVIGNLLQNAVRYAPVTEPIDVTIRDTTTGVDIVVADRGPGLSADDQERLFNPLPRSLAPRAASADADARMGMGLAIARTFARAQRGDVRYEPRAGGGSVFMLCLPRTAAAGTVSAGTVSAGTVSASTAGTA